MNFGELVLTTAMDLLFFRKTFINFVSIQTQESLILNFSEFHPSPPFVSESAKIMSVRNFKAFFLQIIIITTRDYSVTCGDSCK